MDPSPSQEAGTGAHVLLLRACPRGHPSGVSCSSGDPGWVESCAQRGSPGPRGPACA